LEEPGVDGSIILRCIFRKWDVGRMDWIDVAQDRERWRVVVNAVINLRVP
jgi:ribosomal protein S4E